MTTRFYKEARRLWDHETGSESLTRLQAGICLCERFPFIPLSIGTLFEIEVCHRGFTFDTD